MRLRIVLVAGLLGAMLAGTPAAAAANSSAQEDAEALFLAGRDAMRRGDYATACESFAKSRELDPALGTRLNLSYCEAKRGQLLDARRELESILADGRLDERRRAMALRLLAELKGRLARLVVSIPPEAHASTRVRVDGRPLSDGELAHPIEVDPGTHAVDFASTARGDRRVTVMVRERESVVITEPAPLVRAPQQTAPAASRPPSRDGRPALRQVAGTDRRDSGGVTSSTAKRSIGYAIGSVGLAMLVTSAVFGLLALDAAGTKEDHCDERGCDPEGLHAAGRSTQLGNAATATLALGALETGLGTYLLLSAPPPNPERPAGSLANGILIGVHVGL